MIPLSWSFCVILAFETATLHILHRDTKAFLIGNMPAISCYQYLCHSFQHSAVRAPWEYHDTPCTGSRYAHWQQCWGKVSAHPGRLTCQNLTMWSMVSWAWGHQGGDWSSHVDAATNIANNISPGQTHPKAQSRAQFSLWVGTLPVAVFLDCIAGFRSSLRQVVWYLINSVLWWSLSGSLALLQETEEYSEG